MSRAKSLTPAAAVHKHERALHKGRPLTPMKNGGEVMRKKMMVGGPMNKPALPAQASPTAVAARMKMPGQMQRPVAPSGAPMKKGGRACMAAGGVAKVRHNQATSKGAPKAAPKRFKEPLI